MWDNVSEYSNGLKSTFQAILYETTNKIDFRYKNLRIQTHDITIGVQGNNEAVTHLRYEDNNTTTYILKMLLVYPQELMSLTLIYPQNV